MQTQPIVSVIMITYGHEKFIRQALESILLQNCNFQIEIILANDCSPDSTDKIIQEILKTNKNAGWIRYFNHSKNLGMMPNFIQALENCKGKYIALCDGDDYWTDSQKLQKQVDFLESNPNYVLTFHKISILKTDGTIVNDFITKVPDKHETIADLALASNYIHTPSVVFRNCITNYPNELNLSPIGDYFLYLILSQFGKIKYIQDNMAIYRQGVGVWSSLSTNKITLNSAHCFSLIHKYFKSKNNELVSEIFKKRTINSLSSLQSIITKKDIARFALDNELSLEIIIDLSNKIQSLKKEKISDQLQVLLYKILKRIGHRLKF